MIYRIDAGGVMLMRPPLVHDLSKNKEPERRRVGPIEYFPFNRLGGLRWA